MAEVSERERKEKQRQSRKENQNPMVVFRVTPLQKKRLVEVAEYWNVSMTEVLIKSITVAWKNKEERRRIDEEADSKRQELSDRLDMSQGHAINQEFEDE